MSPRHKLKEVPPVNEPLQIVDRPITTRVDTICEALQETLTSGKAVVVPFNSQSKGAAKYRQVLLAAGVEAENHRSAWVPACMGGEGHQRRRQSTYTEGRCYRGTIMNLRPVSQVMGEAWEAAIRRREMSMNLRATVHTYVENMSTDLARPAGLRWGRCSFCGRMIATIPSIGYWTTSPWNSWRRKPGSGRHGHLSLCWTPHSRRSGTMTRDPDDYDRDRDEEPDRRGTEAGGRPRRRGERGLPGGDGGGGPAPAHRLRRAATPAPGQRGRGGRRIVKDP